MSAGGGFAALMAPVGPVAEAWVADQRVIKGLMGPVGSAKTTSAIRVMVQSPGLQDPSPIDGVRRARWCVVRDTYAQLETNVLNSWFTWFPKSMGDYNGREFVHRLKYDMTFLDGRPPQRWELEVYFRAMGDQKAEDVLKGLELTGLWLNETDTLDRAVLAYGIGRTGRYPSALNGGCQYNAVICDFNAPNIDNWCYELFVEQKLPLDAEQIASLREVLGSRFGVGFHRQPGGRSIDPPPENIANLPKGYYGFQMLGMSENLVRRLVDNEFGAVRSGQPVYPEYNDEFHCAKQSLEPVAGVPVALAYDGGATPAALFGQRLDGGQIRWLRELVVFEDRDGVMLERMGPEAFGEMMGDVWLEHFAKCQFGGAWFDPSALFGDEYMDSWARLAWAAFIKRVAAAIPGARQWKAKPAPAKGNRLPVRLEAVRRPLVTNPGGKPGLLISPDCRMTRRGFISGYVHQAVQSSLGKGTYKDVPAKTAESHVHDAGQYLNLGLTKRGSEADLGDGPDMGGHNSRGRRGKVNFGTGPFAHRDAAAGTGAR